MRKTWGGGGEREKLNKREKGEGEMRKPFWQLRERERWDERKRGRKAERGREERSKKEGERRARERSCTLRKACLPSYVFAWNT